MPQVREPWHRSSCSQGNSLTVGPKGVLQSVAKPGKAGTWRAVNRESCTSQPVNSSWTVAPYRQQVPETKSGAANPGSAPNPCSTEGGPRYPSVMGQTNPASAPNPCSTRADPGTQVWWGRQTWAAHTTLLAQPKKEQITPVAKSAGSEVKQVHTSSGMPRPAGKPRHVHTSQWHRGWA